jgi:integrase
MAAVGVEQVSGGDDAGGGCQSCIRLQRQLVEVTAIARDQAKALAELTDECPPWAPSVAIIYWKYSETCWARPNWPRIWNRLLPFVTAFGEAPAMKISPAMWDAHRGRRKAEIIPRKGRGPKDTTLNRELERAKEMFDWAVENKLIKYNPLRPAKAITTVTRRETCLPPADVDRMLAATDDVVDRRRAPGDDDGFRARAMRAFVLCLHDSMLRPGEARNIIRDRIGADGRVEVASRESKSKARRSVFLTPRTLEAIAEVPRDLDCPYVFARDGKRLDMRRLHHWFRQLAEVTGVDALAAPGDERLHPHDLRASGATTADENGARATAIRDALGHKRLATTEIYLRSAQVESARSVAKVIVAATEPRRGPRRAGRKTGVPLTNFMDR